MAESAKNKLPAKKKAEKHGVCTKTLDRWVEAKRLDPPVIINKRKYYDADSEPRDDKTAA